MHELLIYVMLVSVGSICLCQCFKTQKYMRSIVVNSTVENYGIIVKHFVHNMLE